MKEKTKASVLVFREVGLLNLLKCNEKGNKKYQDCKSVLFAKR